MSTQNQVLIPQQELYPSIQTHPIKIVEVDLGGTFKLKLERDESNVFDQFEIVFDEILATQRQANLLRER